MERLYWDSLSFAPGIHTHHAWTEAGEVFARDMRNVRADENAYLRLRQPTGTLSTASPTAAVVGVFATDTHLFWVQSDGTLHAMNLSDTEQAVVTGLEGLSGRLYLVDEFGEFVIGKSEGMEHGFWSDITDPYFTPVTDDGDFPVTTSGDFVSTEDEFVAFSLGLAPPEIPALSAGSVPSQALPDGLYVYAMTAVRGFFGDVDDVPFPRQIAQKAFAGVELFNGMESNPSYFVVKVGGAVGDVFADNNQIHRVLELPSDNQGVFLSDVTFPDAQQTGIYVYRTDVISTGTRGRREDVEALEFRVTDFLHKVNPRSGVLDGSGTLHFGVDITDRPSMRIDNHRLPEGPAQIVYYNDLVFAAVGTELRYSDVRDGAPVQWAWPEANSIRADGDVVFCVEHRGVLLYGGPRGIYRLTGTDEYNFNANDQVSAVGPVSRGAWGKFEDGIGFIGKAGLYITDGVQVQKVSSPFLDGFFETDHAVEGAVVLLPSDDQLWSITFDSGARYQFLRSQRGGFFKWHGAAADQYAVDADVMFVDGTTPEIRTVEFSETVDTALGWEWFSQVIDFKEQGFDETLKAFRWLEVSSSHSGPGLLQVIVDGVSEDDARTFMFRANTQRPVRVPIDRRGERIQFRVSGQGQVILRSLRLMAEVRSSRRRF